MVQHPSSYWSWLLRGEHPGWRRLVDRWLVLHAGIGVAAVGLVPVQLEVAAQTVLLPLAGVFVGMSFAWVGNALAIVQSPEIDRLSEKNPAGFEVLRLHVPDCDSGSVGLASFCGGLLVSACLTRCLPGTVPIGATP